MTVFTFSTFNGDITIRYGFNDKRGRVEARILPYDVPLLDYLGPSPRNAPHSPFLSFIFRLLPDHLYRLIDTARWDAPDLRPYPVWLVKKKDLPYHGILAEIFPGAYLEQHPSLGEQLMVFTLSNWDFSPDFAPPRKVEVGAIRPASAVNLAAGESFDQPMESVTKKSDRFSYDYDSIREFDGVDREEVHALVKLYRSSDRALVAADAARLGFGGTWTFWERISQDSLFSSLKSKPHVPALQQLASMIEGNIVAVPPEAKERYKCFYQDVPEDDER